MNALHEQLRGLESHVEAAMGGAATDRRLAEAGIGPEAERWRAVTERLRARQAQQPGTAAQTDTP